MIILKNILAFSYVICNLVISFSPVNSMPAGMTLQPVVEKLPYLSSETREFYKTWSYAPVWYEEGQLNQLGKIVLEIIQNVELEGLNSQDYLLSQSGIADPQIWAEQDIQLTNLFLKFIKEVRNGRVIPSQTDRSIKLHLPLLDVANILHEALTSAHPEEALKTISPNLPEYQALKKVLVELHLLKNAHPHWIQLRSPTSIKPGMEHEDVVATRQALIWLEDFHPENAEDLTSFKHDEKLVQAVKHFQQRHTLEPDGIIGGKTRDSLNMVPQERINKVIVNLERLRWLPKDLGERYIDVNIAGYELKAYAHGKMDTRIPIIVGKHQTQTPLFYAQLKTVVVNPSWGVPTSILMRDKLPKIRQDPSYLQRSGFTVYDADGQIVDPYQVDWQSAGSHYRLRQKPGAKNALGRIKFHIENSYSIYLHGTPDESLFKKVSRAFSSGCIRLQHPADLAVWVLHETQQWDEENLKKAINTGQTKDLALLTSIPVYFTYQTVWIAEDGLIHFSNDPYEMDKHLQRMLKLPIIASDAPIVSVVKA